MSGYVAPWRSRLRPASFRGVPFYVRAAQTQVGRRNQLHEYPQRDEAYNEDLGQKADAFSIEAIILGPDYFTARDTLIEALKARGSGKLVHPYYGERTVALAGPARIEERAEEGGLARFQLDFVEAGDDVTPIVRPDTASAVESAADEANAALADDFANTYTLDGAPDFVADSASSLASDALSALDGARRAMVVDQAVLAEYMAMANAATGQVTSLIRAPAAFAQSVLGMIGSLKTLAASPAYALASYRGLFDYGTDRAAISVATPSRRQQAANQAALDGLVRRGALIEGARLASRVTVSTYDDAVALRDELAERLDAEACGGDVGDALYRRMTALRVAAVRDLSARAIIAPRVTRATLPSTMPALVAAHRLYGDARRADELLARNPTVRHPGFVPGGVALEIIAD